VPGLAQLVPDAASRARTALSSNPQALRPLGVRPRLPDDKGRRGDGRQKAHRFRSYWRELSRQLRDFRARYGVTPTEIARAIGAGDASTVAQRESGVDVPEALQREGPIELLDGQHGPEVHALVPGARTVQAGHDLLEAIERDIAMRCRARRSSRTQNRGRIPHPGRIPRWTARPFARTTQAVDRGSPAAWSRAPPA
jgi:hypothetical protein